MWNTNTIWFDIGLLTGMSAFGQLFFAHWELHTARWRKVAKLFLLIGIVVVLSSTWEASGVMVLLE